MSYQMDSLRAHTLQSTYDAACLYSLREVGVRVDVGAWMCRIGFRCILGTFSVRYEALLKFAVYQSRTDRMDRMILMRTHRSVGGASVDSRMRFEFGYVSME